MILLVTFSVNSRPASAQQVRTGGTTTGAGGQAMNAGLGGTTEGLGGLTTGGLATEGAADGGFAGANAAQGFVGGGATDGGFVGGSREAAAGFGNANRQFRGITDTGIFAGSTQQQTGTPRRIPVSFRVSFQTPTISQLQAGASAPANQISVQRFSVIRPELSGITANVSPQGVVTLTGAVADASSSRLAANLLRLQPGVRAINNQVQVIPR
jgi:hypothetical protein